MSHPLIMLAAGVIVVAAALSGVVTSWLSVLGGASLPNAIIRGGVALGGTLTVELLTLGFLLGR